MDKMAKERTKLSKLWEHTKPEEIRINVKAPDKEIKRLHRADIRIKIPLQGGELQSLNVEEGAMRSNRHRQLEHKSFDNQHLLASNYLNYMKISSVTFG